LSQPVSCNWVSASPVFLGFRDDMPYSLLFVSPRNLGPGRGILAFFCRRRHANWYSAPPKKAEHLVVSFGRLCLILDPQTLFFFSTKPGTPNTRSRSFYQTARRTNVHSFLRHRNVAATFRAPLLQPEKSLRFRFNSPVCAEVPFLPRTFRPLGPLFVFSGSPQHGC